MTSYPINVQFTTAKINSEQDLFEISPTFSETQDEIFRQLCEQNCLPALSLIPPCARILGAFKVNGSAVFCKAINVGSTDVQIQGTIRFKDGRFQGFNKDGWVFLDCCDEPIDDHLDTGVIFALCAGEDHAFILPDDDLSTNASISIGPKGTGFICAQIPTPGSSVGGNCRGMNAVDWQQVRSSADQVAGAARSVITGGSDNRITPTSTNSGILSGFDNSIDNSLYSSVTSGRNNNINFGDSVTGDYNFIGSGLNNFINIANDCISNYSGIVGGRNNIIGNRISSTTDFCFIGGGENNIIVDGSSSQTATHNSIVGGTDNNIGFDMNTNTSFCIIGGGVRNIIDDSSAAAILSGNMNNINESDNSTIVAGNENMIITSADSFIGGGTSNSIETNGNLSFIGGGQDNHIVLDPLIISLARNVIGGGLSNEIRPVTSRTANESFIGGGEFNTIKDDFCTLAGGRRNKINNITEGAFIGGGWDNIISDSVALTIDCSWSSIVGGRFNTISGTDTSDLRYSVISGGLSNTIGGSDDVTLPYSVIAGGQDNIINDSALSSSHCTISGGQENTITKSDGRHTIVGGRNLTISNTNTHTGAVTVCGQFNEEIARMLAGGMGTITTVGSVGTDRVFTVANGTMGSPLNEFSVTSDGFANARVGYRAGGADFAEFFESDLGEKIPAGTSVVFANNGKIKSAQLGEIPFGVISNTCNMIGNSFDEEWWKKYEKDEFGTYIYEEEEIEEPVYEFIEKEVDIKRIVKKNGRYYEINDKKTEKKKVPIYEKVTIYDENDQPIREETVRKTIIKKNRKLKISKNFDPNKKYIPRRNRPEWNVVGLVGQVFIKKGQPVAPNWIKIKETSPNVELWLIK